MSIDLFRAELGDQGLDDSGDLQLAKNLLGYAGEEFTGVHRVQQFGFTGMPPAGAHGIGLALRGMRDLAVVLGVEHPQYRLKNRESGSTAIYDQHGNIVSLVQANISITHATKIVLQVGSMKVVIQANRIDLGADPAPYAVETSAGPSTKVFAVI